MRILYVVNTFGAGGAERHLLALVQHMMRVGHSVMVVALTGRIAGGARDLKEDFAQTGAKLEVLDGFGSGILKDIARWQRLNHLVGEWKPDIVHSHLPRADLAASVVKWMHPDMVWVCTIHDAYIKAVYSGHWIFPWLGWNWRRTDHAIAVSGHAERWAVRTLGLEEHQASVIYHGIKESRGPSSAERRAVRTDPAPRIGCLARFEERKGIATLVRAMPDVCARYPAAKLVLAGSDPAGYAKKMQELAVRLGVGHAVEILGFCDAPMDFLRSLDVFALASSVEGFGMVLIEAMSVELPIVASDIYPINYIVEFGRTGLLAEPGNPQAFAAAIVDLFDHPEKARAMGEAGRQRCAAEFSEAKMMNSIINLYQELAVVAGR